MDNYERAIERLRTWSDPKASGSPTKRMQKIWLTPMHMAADIHTLLELIK